MRGAQLQNLRHPGHPALQNAFNWHCCSQETGFRSQRGPYVVFTDKANKRSGSHEFFGSRGPNRDRDCCLLRAFLSANPAAWPPRTKVVPRPCFATEFGFRCRVLPGAIQETVAAHPSPYSGGGSGRTLKAF